MKDILLISQDGRFQSASKSYLEQNGDFNVILESDPERIVDVIRWTDFDAIICEHSGLIDSIDLVTALRESEIDTPFILVYDPYLSEEMVPRGLEAGADYVFKKMAIPSMNARSLMRMLEIAIESHMQLHTALAIGEQYRQVVENAEALIIMIDRQDRVRFINRSCLDLTGYMWDEVLGRPAIGRIFPVQSSDGKDVKVLLHDRLEHPSESMDVLELLCKDGSLHLISWRHTVSEDAEGQYLLSVGVPTALVQRALPVQHPFLLLDQISEAYYSMDSDLRIQFFNAEAERVLNKKREDVLGKNILEAFPILRDTEFHRKLVHAVKGQEAVKFELDLNVPGWTRNWYYVRLYPLGDSIGVFFAKTTEMKKVEAALRDSEARYRNFLEHAYEAILILDPEGNVQYLNHKMADILDQPIERIQGVNITRFLSEDDMKLFDRVHSLGDKVGQETFEYSFVKPSGKRSVFSVTLTPRRDEEGRFLGLSLLINDITQGKKDQERLYLQSRVLDQMRDAVVVIGLDLRVRYWNSYATELFGWTQEEMVGKDPIVMIAIDPVEAVHQLVEGLKGSDRIETTSSAKRKDGTTFLASVTSSSLKDNQGKVIGYLGVFRDVTQSDAMEKAFKMASQKLSLVSRITRHDLRNQLTVLAGNLDMASSSAKGSGAERYIEKAIDTARNISDLIEFTKDYESLGTKGAKWESAERLCRQGMSRVDLEGIDLDVMVRDLELFVDPMLEKVFHNLADNSVRHGEKVKHIEVSYRNEGDGMIMAYADDGVGIPHNMKEQVLSEGSSRHGMRLVREILRINGMDIKEVGQYHEGVRFEISIPAGRYRILENSF